jgi:hypothetical protein
VFEKPLAHDYKTGSEILALLKYHQKDAIVTYQLRHDLSLLSFRERLKAENLGKLLSVDVEIGQYLPDWRPNKDYRNSVTANTRLGGGVLLELSHEIDYILWLFGEPGKVMSKVTKLSNLEMDAEDYVSATLSFEENCVVRLNLDCFRRDKTRICIVRFENGTIKWDGLNYEISSFNLPRNSWEKLSTIVNNAHLNQWNDIVRFMETGRSSSSTVQEALTVLSLVETIKLSSAKNGAVSHGVKK